MKHYNYKKLSVACALVGMTSFLQTPLQAEELDVQWSNTLSYGAMWRIEKQNEANIIPAIPSGSPVPILLDSMGQPVTGPGGFPEINPNYNPDYITQAAQAGRVANGNDGNRNFEKNDMVSSRLGILSEIGLQYGRFSAFVRARAWYDSIYDQKKPQSYNPNYLGGFYPAGDFNGDTMGEFQDELRDFLGSNIELLDAFISADLDLGSMPLSLRIGRQAISWGESMAFQNSISSAINPVDANAGTRAGVELKEILRPTESVYAQLGLTPSISMEAFWQWQHRATELLPSGAYFSEQDMLGEGGNKMIISGSMPYTMNDQRDTVDDGNEFGLAFKYFSDSGTEYGIYAINTHDKSPSLQAFQTQPPIPQLQQPGMGYYLVDYKENIKTYGLSISTVLGNTNISGELSYRPNATVYLDPNCVEALGCNDHAPSEVSEAELTQMQVSFVHVYGTNIMWDQLTLTGEVVGWQYGAIEGADRKDENSLLVTNTPNGVGTLLRGDWQWNNVFLGANLSIPVTWQYGWKGTNSRTNSREDASILSVGAKMLFPSDWETSLVYTRYDGEDEDQFDKNFYHLSDRDNIAFAINYTF